MKKLLCLLLSLLLLGSLFGCGAGEQPEIVSGDPATEIDTTVEEEETVESYPNVEGYPVEKNGISFCKVFINGEEFMSDGYVKNDAPDTLFVAALDLTYQTGCDAICCSTDKNGKRYESFGASVNGKLVLSTMGEACLNIDGEVFEDLAPEKAEVYEGFEDYCCTTLFLEKTVGATVTFSADKSAAYIELGEPVSEEASKIYDLDLDPVGKLTATNKSDGTVTKLVMPSTQVSSGSSNGSSGGSSGGGSSGGSSAPARQRCSRCGGSGFTNGSVMVFDPAFGGMRSETRTITCPSCGGTGWA